MPGGEPEVRVYPATSYQLTLVDPITRWRTGVGLRSYSAVVLVHASTVQVPAYLTILRALRARRHMSRPRVVVVAHNVFPHERHFGDTVLVRALLSRAAAVLVHSPELAALAKTVVSRTQIVFADIPPHLPAFPLERQVMTDADEPFNRLLFFGTVRPSRVSMCCCRPW